jgi:uncharacterized integral membrane protein
MRKLLNWLLLVPLAILLILLSVANRQPTTLSLDPMNVEAPAFSVELPLFILMFLILIAGILIGSFLTWVSQGKHRKALREKSYEANQLERKNDEIKKKASDGKSKEIAPGLPLLSSN